MNKEVIKSLKEIRSFCTTSEQKNALCEVVKSFGFFDIFKKKPDPSVIRKYKRMREQFWDVLERLKNNPDDDVMFRKRQQMFHEIKKFEGEVKDIARYAGLNKLTIRG